MGRSQGETRCYIITTPTKMDYYWPTYASVVRRFTAGGFRFGLLRQNGSDGECYGLLATQRRRQREVCVTIPLSLIPEGSAFVLTPELELWLPTAYAYLRAS